jgi:hypothetical protein
LLNQVFGARAERVEYLYGARVAELFNETAPRLAAPSAPDLTVRGAADIRAAFGIVALRGWVAECKRASKDRREELLYDIEKAAKSMRDLIGGGYVAPAMARRLDTEASAAEAVVHAPENTAIRKPGSPRPVYGW